MSALVIVYEYRYRQQKKDIYLATGICQADEISTLYLDAREIEIQGQTIYLLYADNLLFGFAFSLDISPQNLQVIIEEIEKIKRTKILLTTPSDDIAGNGFASEFFWQPPAWVVEGTSTLASEAKKDEMYVLVVCYQTKGPYTYLKVDRIGHSQDLLQLYEESDLTIKKEAVDDSPYWVILDPEGNLEAIIFPLWTGVWQFKDGIQVDLYLDYCFEIKLLKKGAKIIGDRLAPWLIWASTMK